MPTSHGIDRTGTAGGTGQPSLIGAFSDLTDPGYDAFVIWDDSATAAAWIRADGVGSLTDGNFLVADGSGWAAESGNTARTSLGVGSGDAPTFSGGVFTASCIISAGAALVVRDSGNTDSLAISHNGTNCTFLFTNTTAAIFSSMDRVTVAGDIYVTGGHSFTIFDSTGVDYGSFTHDGANLNLATNNVANFNIIGVTTAFWIRDGAGLKISDSGDTDFVVMSHDGTDFNIVATNTTEINVFGASNFVFTSCGLVFAGGGSKNFVMHDNTGAATGFQILNFTDGITYINKPGGESIIFRGLSNAVRMTLTSTSLDVAFGINFPDTQVSSSDANTLDDYEEGTWTPVLTFGTPGDLAVTYSSQSGKYTKIGNQVTCTLSLQTSSFTHASASGNSLITGLPFTNLTGSISSGQVDWSGISNASYTGVVLIVNGASTQITPRQTGMGVASSNVTSSDIPSGGTVIFRGTYSYLT